MTKDKFNDVRITPEAAEWKSEVELATNVLCEVVGRSSQLVNVDWEVSKDYRDRTMLRLKLKDSFGSSAQTDFAPDEFKNDAHLRRRLYSLWGDVLQQKAERQMEKLQLAFQQRSEE